MKNGQHTTSETFVVSGSTVCVSALIGDTSIAGLTVGAGIVAAGFVLALRSTES